MNKIELANGIYYVGVVDWNLRDFHGYYTSRGVTYNSYLIVDEKVCLIDTVKAPYAGELIDRISSIIDPSKIDYVIVNHVEPDHSSALPTVMQYAPNAVIIATEHGKNEIIKHFHRDYPINVVKEGDKLNIGSRNLAFVPLPMLHWPDSMATYLEEDRILFSNDAFGQHISTTHRFDDENNFQECLFEAEKYYANILLPYTRLIPKALEKVRDLPINMIAPSHGVVWRKHINDILNKYAEWGSSSYTNKVVVLYDTMWGGTEKMARRILEGVAATGMKGKLYRLSSAERSDVVHDILTARGIIIGSPTLNGTVMPTVGAMLFYLKGLRPSNKYAAAFGTYGWNCGAQKDIEEFLKAASFKVTEGYFTKWDPDKNELDKCFEYGFNFASSIRE